MSYVDNGTFWVVILVVAAVIYTVWNKLKKELDATSKSLKDTQKILADASRELAEAETSDSKKMSATLADIYNGLASAYEILAILENGASKPTQAKLKEYHKKHGGK